METHLYGGGFLVVAEEREGARAEFVTLSLFLACSCNQVSPGPISLRKHRTQGLVHACTHCHSSAVTISQLSPLQ